MIPNKFNLFAAKAREEPVVLGGREAASAEPAAAPRPEQRMELDLDRRHPRLLHRRLQAGLAKSRLALCARGAGRSLHLRGIAMRIRG